MAKVNLTVEEIKLLQQILRDKYEYVNNDSYSFKVSSSAFDKLQQALEKKNATTN